MVKSILYYLFIALAAILVLSFCTWDLPWVLHSTFCTIPGRIFFAVYTIITVAIHLTKDYRPPIQIGDKVWLKGNAPTLYQRMKEWDIISISKRGSRIVIEGCMFAYDDGGPFG